MNEPEFTEEEPITLLDYLLPLLRWRWMIFIGCALFGILGILSALSKSPYYTATAFFVPAGSFGERDELAALAGKTGKDWAKVRSASDVVKYYGVALKVRPVLEQLLSAEFYSSEQGHKPLREILSAGRQARPSDEELIRDLRRKLTVKSGGGKLITLSYTSGEAQLSAAVVNAVFDRFAKLPRHAKAASADTEFIKGRLEDVHRKLEDKERAVSELKSKSLDSGQPETIRQLAALEREARLLEKMYENLNTEYARSEIRMVQNQREASREIEIMERAEAPLERTGPDRRKSAILFLLMGGVLTCGAAFVIEYFRNMQRHFTQHPFWDFLKRARRDLVIMAILVILLLILALAYLALR